jgi:hypothetical protein
MSNDGCYTTPPAEVLDWPPKQSAGRVAERPTSSFASPTALI